MGTATMSQYWLCCKQVSDKNKMKGLIQQQLSQYWLCCKQVSDKKESSTYRPSLYSLNTGFVVSRFLTSLDGDPDQIDCLNTGFVVSRFLTQQSISSTVITNVSILALL